ncbi:MAG: hypothetical protein PHV06_09840 [bacterium]|nr:hypothetical protein [bacterium]
MKVKIFFIIIILIMISLKPYPEEKIFIPEYEFNKFGYVDSFSRYSSSYWMIIAYSYEQFNLDKYYFFKEREDDNRSGIGLIRYKFSDTNKAKESVTEYKRSSNTNWFPILPGTISRKKIGFKNYVQGTGIFSFDELKISDIDFYTNYEYQIDKLYHFGLFVIMEDGWTFEVYQTFFNYQPWMGRLDPEMLEYLAEKGVEVYYAKKCEIKIEPHKWNMNWAEDNADPEGVINLWIGNLEEGISVEDIDLSTIVLNGKVPIFKNVGYENNENFQGKVLHLQFKKKESFETIFFPQKGDKREICIEGKLKSGENFIGRTEIEIIGKEK